MSSRRRRPPTRLGAWGVTVLLLGAGLGKLEAIPAGRSATAASPARRLQPPAAATPAADPAVTTVIALTNQARAAAGVGPLTENVLVDTAAAGHSQDQAAHDTMTHTGTNGSNAGQRITAAGYTWRTWGENVAYGQRSAAQVVDAWMNSAGHRANMLNGAFTGIGIGVAAAADGTLYWTMDLVG